MFHGARASDVVVMKSCLKASVDRKSLRADLHFCGLVPLIVDTGRGFIKPGVITLWSCKLFRDLFSWTYYHSMEVS